MTTRQKVEKPSDRSKRKRNRELNDIRSVLNTPEGRRFYWRILEQGQIFKDGFVAGDNGYGSTRNLGTRKVGLWALSELMEARPDAFTKMQREHASEAKREENEDKERVNTKSVLETQ